MQERRHVGIDESRRRGRKWWLLSVFFCCLTDSTQRRPRWKSHAGRYPVNCNTNFSHPFVVPLSDVKTPPERLARSCGGLHNHLLCQNDAPSVWHALPLVSEGRPINSLLYTYDRPRSVRILTCSCDAGSATRIDHQPSPDQYEHEESPSG